MLPRPKISEFLAWFAGNGKQINTKDSEPHGFDNCNSAA
jgi:hypothetical protein